MSDLNRFPLWARPKGLYITRSMSSRKSRRLRVRQVAIGAVAVAASVGLATPPALAATSTISGNANLNNQPVPGTFTKQGTGDVTINYYNGIGVGGNDLLYMRLCSSNTSCFADTRLLTEKRVYTLGVRVLNGTRFRVQYRRDSGSFNPYWEGSLRY